VAILSSGPCSFGRVACKTGENPNPASASIGPQAESMKRNKIITKKHLACFMSPFYLSKGLVALIVPEYQPCQMCIATKIVQI
jgi:hypothetical protein